MPIRSSNAYYAAEVAALRRASPEEIIGALVTNSSFSVDPAQRDAWLLQITILQSSLAGLNGTLFLEFVVPRIGSRLDVVLISGPAIFAVEFKVGESDYRRADVNQVWDYALDLKNFHKGSHDAPIVPILVATEAPSSDTALPVPHADSDAHPDQLPSGRPHSLVRDPRKKSRPRRSRCARESCDRVRALTRESRATGCFVEGAASATCANVCRKSRRWRPLRQIHLQPQPGADTSDRALE